MNIKTMFYSVPDPDFEIRGGGGLQKRFFSALLLPPLDPPVLLIVNLTVISPYSLI